MPQAVCHLAVAAQKPSKHTLWLLECTCVLCNIAALSALQNLGGMLTINTVQLPADRDARGHYLELQDSQGLSALRFLSFTFLLCWIAESDIDSFPYIKALNIAAQASQFAMRDCTSFRSFAS